MNSESSAISAHAPSEASVQSALSVHFGLLTAAHASGDKRLAGRVLRHLPTIRKRLDLDAASRLADHGSQSPVLVAVRALLPAASGQAASGDFQGLPPFVAETEVYVCLLATVCLIDAKLPSAAAQCAFLGIRRSREANLRTLDSLAACLYFYLARAFELGGDSNGFELYPYSLPTNVARLLMAGLTTSTLRHDDETRATVYASLLRLHVLRGDFEAAERLVQKSAFPASVANGQLARYHYYVACIRAVQGSYGEARDALLGCVGRGPQGDAGVGFLQAVHRLLVVVQLLLGEIPERSIFRQARLAKSLMPYLALTNAVRLGDLRSFEHVLQEHAAAFNADSATPLLIARLPQSVLRAGLKRICSAYSRISFADVARKLGIASPEDAQYIALKAIHDGVIDATADVDHSILISRGLPHVYSTSDPQDTLHVRISQCQALRRDALQAMRFSERSSKRASKTGKQDSLLDAAVEDADAFDDGDIAMDEDGDLGF